VKQKGGKETRFVGKSLTKKQHSDKTTKFVRKNCIKIGKNGIKSRLAQNVQWQKGNQFTIKH